MIGRLPFPVTHLAWRIVLVLAAATAAITELVVPWEQPSGMALPLLSGPAELGHVAPPVQSAYPSIAEHPLFQASRMPWVAAPLPSPVSPSDLVPPPGGYTLAGIVLSGGERSAILQSAGTARVRVLTEGETLDGWTLRRIDADGAHFEAGSQTFDLAIKYTHPGVR
jgi:hypothetical protein